MQPKLVTLSYSPSDRLHVDECERRSERLLLATGLPICRYEVVNTYPHDPEAFTQGLTYKDGFLFESTGGWGRSSIRQVRIEDGAVLKRSALPPSVFGEGLVFWEGEIISLTWRDGIGFRWSGDTLLETGRLPWKGEGWGITHNSRELIVSDGSSVLQFLAPHTFRELRAIEVTAAGRPLPFLNDLEWVEGEIWANVWMTDLIARIDPESGRVTRWVDCRGLRRASLGFNHNSVLNGIAYDAGHGRLYLTGKNWACLSQLQYSAGGPEPFPVSDEVNSKTRVPRPPNPGQ
jgi:glutaminyl-peptide cyclotransferase